MTDTRSSSAYVRSGRPLAPSSSARVRSGSPFAPSIPAPVRSDIACLRAAFCAALILAAVAATPPHSSGQEPVTQGPGIYHLADNPAALVPEVSFLPQAPNIDGLLDPGLETLPIGRFSEVEVDGRGPELDATNAAAVTAALPTYRMAYGTDFFYLYVEAPGEKLHFRDRGYQNGDGFSIVLGATRPDNAATDEFYVLSCSAVDDSSLEWTRHVFWYYNVDDIFLGTSDKTRLEFAASNGRISFELYLSWHDVHPHHPWISDGIGFNLRFVMAVGDGVRYKYIVVPDEIGAENSNRLYMPLVFEPPHALDGSQTFVILERGNIRQGALVRCLSVTAAPVSGEERITLRVKADLPEAQSEQYAQYAYATGLTRHAFDLDTSALTPGTYPIQADGPGGAELLWAELTVLPEVDFPAMRTRLRAREGQAALGSIHTIAWNIDNLQQELAKVRPYETCERQRASVELLGQRIDQLERGDDFYARRTGIFRRAHWSHLDETLQPYVVIVPDSLDRGRPCPLIVFLHGSASDETNIAGFRDLVPPNCIGLGPRGRGPSNWYCFEHAQTDIAEAIDDVIANYPIDEKRIILTGFSMGGYGVYRTFYETPRRYRAVAVLSGMPFAGRIEEDPCAEDTEATHAAQPDAAQPDAGAVPLPDFRCPDRLAAFRGVPVFIYHGEQDRNCTYQLTAEHVERMRAAGAIVEFVSAPNQGHQAPTEKGYQAYRRWLDPLLAGE
jgi:predicted esterase